MGFGDLSDTFRRLSEITEACSRVIVPTVNIDVRDLFIGFVFGSYFSTQCSINPFLWGPFKGAARGRVKSKKIFEDLSLPVLLGCLRRLDCGARLHQRQRGPVKLGQTKNI